MCVEWGADDCVTPVWEVCSVSLSACSVKSALLNHRACELLIHRPDSTPARACDTYSIKHKDLSRSTWPVSRPISELIAALAHPCSSDAQTACPTIPFTSIQIVYKFRFPNAPPLLKQWLAHSQSLSSPSSASATTPRIPPPELENHAGCRGLTPA